MEASQAISELPVCKRPQNCWAIRAVNDRGRIDGRRHGCICHLSRRGPRSRSLEEYKSKGAASILAAGGKYIVRGGDVELLEGEPPAGRTVILEFPTRQAALDWYRGTEYSEIRKIRVGAARVTQLYVVDGVV